MSDLGLGKESIWLPEGPNPGADLRLTTTGVVVEVDIPGARVNVSYNDGSGTWLPAIPAIYTTGQTCVVLLNPLMGSRGEVVLGPIQGEGLVQTGMLVSLDTSARTGVVTVAGQDYTLPYLQGAYSTGTLVWVQRNPSKWGQPELVLGSWAPAVAPTPPPPPDPVPVPPAPPTTQQVTTTIIPQWSGTWRASRSAWDRWNTDRFGGRSDLYQGESFGSGPLSGLATYGDQIVNLGAISIDNMVLALVGNNGSGMAGPAVVQGSPHGSQPAGGPGGSGDIATADMSATTIGYMALPGSIREGMRTGAVRGLALVGGSYLGVAGTGTAGSMTLTITYTRSA